jgi:S1-C subfamily serine protease
MAQLQQRVGFKKPGEMVDVTVQRRGGEQRTVKVRLQAADAARLAGRADSQATPDRGRGEQPMERGLGISVEPITQEDAAARSIEAVRDAGGGLVVTDVSPDGPAFGKITSPTQVATDIILKVENQPTRSRADLRAALRNAKAGDIVTVVIYRKAGDGSRGAQRVVRLRMP